MIFDLRLLYLGFVLITADPEELRGYVTVDKAQATTIRAGSTAQTGFLGAAVARDARGKLVVEEVQSNSPAAQAGVKKGDVITHVAGHAVKSGDGFREWLQTRGPEETVKLRLLRGDSPMEVTAKLAATSRPMKLGAVRAFFGAEMGEPKEGEGVIVDRVVPESPAAAAGLKNGDVIAKIEGVDFNRPGRLAEIVAEKRPGDKLLFSVLRSGTAVALSATLTTEGRGPGRGGPAVRPGDTSPTSVWKKNNFRLAVILIEFADVKHNEKVNIKDWEAAFFSRNEYRNKSNATGVPVQGSLADYYHDISAGAFRLEGRVLPWIDVGKKRNEYIQGTGTSNKLALPNEALEKLAVRDGKEALKEFDGIAFLYAGERYRTNAGAVYYPHSGSVGFQGKRLPYLMGIEGGPTMTPVGGFVKDFGRVLGLPDLAARPENQGSEGLGVWSALSNPFAHARPQHFDAWAKEKIGWLKPVIVDPTVKQKLILAPVESSATECYKILVRPDGSEYLLLENRRKTGFDSDLPGEGLLIWRVVGDRPILEESHGVEGPTGPTVYTNAVPYPSSASNAFTPYTTPSSSSPAGGGLPVHISQIRRLPDGRIAFHIGYEFD